jgi:mono/diheme cytochrome c family protein
MKSYLVMPGVIACIVTALAFTSQQEDPWKVPKNYETLKNPVAADKASINSGKEIYGSYCRTCHGTDGKGDGKRSVNLDKAPGDFALASFQQQTDGALLYKIYFGHREMPGFIKKIPDADAVSQGNFGKTRNPGDLVNYIRTFAKK